MNVGRKPLFVIDQDCLEITDRVIQDVEAAGMKALRSFDLQAIRSASQDFCCPIHGTSACSCQLVVLLIMACGGSSPTIILEGRDQKTWIYIDLGQGETEEQVDTFLTGALTHAFFAKEYYRPERVNETVKQD